MRIHVCETLRMFYETLAQYTFHRFTKLSMFQRNVSWTYIPTHEGGKINN